MMRSSDEEAEAIAQARIILDCAYTHDVSMPANGKYGLYDYMDARTPNREQAKQWGLELRKIRNLGGPAFKKWCQDNADKIGYSIGSEHGAHFVPITKPGKPIDDKAGANMTAPSEERFVLKSKNTIFYGPPGTGKTYAVRKILKGCRILDENSKEKQIEWSMFEFVTFHQSYSYEDFVEGIRPILVDEKKEALGDIKYRIHDGIFKRICNEAKKEENKDNKYALVIDEINRGNISKIFGELITLIEDDKRSGVEEKMEVTLPYSGEKCCVPENLYIIGTMNTADRSLALMDTALRRRFDFIHVYPKPSKLPKKEINGVNLEKLLTTINNRIAALNDKEHCIGHAYLWDMEDIDQLAHVFENKILPLLEEYFFEDHKMIHLVLGYAPFYKKVPEDAFLKEKLDYEYPEQWEINKDVLDDPDTYKKIYE